MTMLPFEHMTISFFNQWKTLGDRKGKGRIVALELEVEKETSLTENKDIRLKIIAAPPRFLQMNV